MEIKSRQDSLYDFGAVLLIGLFYITLGALLAIKSGLLGSIVIILALRVTIYQALDLCVQKTIAFEGGDVVLRIFGLRFKLSSKSSFLNIEKMFVPVSSYAQPTTLNIYRNPSNFFQRLFKNKIKLNVVTKDNIDKVKDEARAISNTFGIRFIDHFEFE